MSTPAPERKVSPADYIRLVLIAAVIGVPAAFVAALFLALVHDIEHWLWDDLPDALGYSSVPWFLVIGLPVAGAAIVVLARLFLPGDGGHRPIDGLSAEPTPLAFGPGVAIAALASLPFGAVLGPEAPVVALGSVVGMAVVRFVRVSGPAEHVLATAGSFSAISALFGGPIVAGMLLVESGLGMGAALLPILLPGFVAAAVGYVIFVGLGDWGGLETQGLTVPSLPPYNGTHIRDLLLGVLVGVLGAVVVVAVRRLGERTDGLHGRTGMPTVLLGGALALGLIAVIADALGANSQDVLFSGQASIPVLVSESGGIIALLLVAKFLAYGVSLGCGFRGGPIFPAIFLGIALSSFAVAWFDTSPTLAVAIGAGAGMAAQTRLIVAPLIFASLLVGTNGVDTIPATTLAIAAAWITIDILDPKQPVEPAAAAA